MVPLKDFYHELLRRLENGEEVAVASIARRIGSAPRNQGTRCAVLKDGTILGTIGGGLLEARTQDEAKTVLATGKPFYLKMRMDSKDLAASGMICGGSVDILIAPWGESEKAVAKELIDLYDSNGRGVLLTLWDEETGTSEVSLLTEETVFEGRYPGLEALKACREALNFGNPVLSTSEGKKLLADPIEREKSPLVIFGAGHVGKALSTVASFAGFSVTLVDDREDFADPALLPHAAAVLCAPFEEAFSKLKIDETTFIVICTRGHLGDAVCAVEAMNSPSPYVGMIGSKRKKSMVLKRLLEAGISEEKIRDVLRTPVGLEINAETPEEIAVSIVAEMIGVKRSG